MLVSDLLERKPDVHPDHIVCCTETDTVGHAIDTMLEHNIGAILVKNNTGLAGIYSERDVMRGLQRMGSELLAEVLKTQMVTDLISVNTDQTIDEALDLMRGNRIRHLPVMADDVLTGFLSIRDLMSYKIDTAKKSAEMLQQQILAANQTLPM